MPKTTTKKKATIQKSPLLNVLLITIPLVTIVFVVLFILVHAQIQAQTNTIMQLEEELATTQEELEYYKEAYQITLADIRQLSTQFGGEERYDTIAREFREQELPTTQEEIPQYIIPNEQTWQEYVDEGIIQTSCLETVRVPSTLDELLFTVRLSAQEEGVASFYVNANNIFNHELQETQLIQFSVPLTRGVHAFDIATNAQFVLEELTIETTTLSQEDLTIDYGEQWQIFNCQDTITGNVIEQPGAIRVLLEKT